MRLFPAPDFVPLDLSIKVLINGGTTGALFSLPAPTGKRRLRLTSFTLGNQFSGGLTGSDWLMLHTDVPGLGDLDALKVGPSSTGVFHIPLFHEIDGNVSGSCSLENPATFGNLTMMARLCGFYHRGDASPDDPGVWRPSRRSRLFQVSVETAAAIANNAEGPIGVFRTPLGSRIRLWGIIYNANNNDKRGVMRVIGPGCGHLQSLVLPCNNNSQETGLVHPVLAVLEPGQSYEVRFLRQATVGNGTYTATFFGWTIA